MSSRQSGHESLVSPRTRVSPAYVPIHVPLRTLQKHPGAELNAPPHLHSTTSATATMAHELQLPQLAFAPASHRVFFNHVILERLVDVHPDVADLLALGATCRQLYHDIRYLLPRAQHLSFSPVKPTSSLTLARFLAHHLEGESGSPSRLRIVDDRRTVVVNGPVGAPYTTSWGRLRDLDLSGTSVSSGIINVLIGACAGGRVPEIGSWLNLNAYWQKDFLCGNNDSGRAAAKRILHDQALRLERLAFTNCPNVEIRNVVGFLLRILKSATQAERNRIREQQANSNSASNATLHPAAANTPAVLANIAAIPATQTTQVAYAGMMMGQAMPFHAGMPFVVPGNGQTFNFPVLVHAPNGSNILPGPVELARGDLANIPVPLPADADQLQAYNLPCLSLKRLDIANTSGLYVDDKYAGRSEWGNEWQFPQSHTLAYMQTVCGCLGIDIDVMFCQNYRCAQAVKDEL